MSIPIPQITANGLIVPSYSDILTGLKEAYYSIYGSDAYLEDDSKDGQLLGVFALALFNSNNFGGMVYNSFSPATAQGVGLSNVVKINGLARLIPSKSTADVKIVGQVGTVITNGIVADTFSNRWDLPASVTVPSSGEVTVTATAQQEGDIRAEPNTITKIITPTRGWQSVTNLAAATPGAPVESDAALRRRQSVSTSLPAQSILEAIVGAVANLDGVQRWQAYENDTNNTDADGLPPHSISLVVEGGDAAEIAEVIARKKNPGTTTYGTTTELVIDSVGIPINIHFYRPTTVDVAVQVNIDALSGYVSTTGDLIKEAIVAFINGLGIGKDIYDSKLYSPANNTGYGDTYNVTSILMSRDGDPLSPDDMVIAFNELAACDIEDIEIVVTP